MGSVTSEVMQFSPDLMASAPLSIPQTKSCSISLHRLLSIQLAESSLTYAPHIPGHHVKLMKAIGTLISSYTENWKGCFRTERQDN